MVKPRRPIRPSRVVVFHDQEPDRFGRRGFTMFWVGSDFLRYGKLRAQVFFTDPTHHHPHAVIEAGPDQRAQACRVLGIPDD